ncbi:terminase large subunit, partial [Burkholderia sp. SIMBA_013]
DDFIDAIETSQGAHDAPLLIAISTQAANDADLFSIWLDAAERDKDPTIVSHLYTTPIECDLMDHKGWEASNPALGL